MHTTWISCILFFGVITVAFQYQTYKRQNYQYNPPRQAYSQKTTGRYKTVLDLKNQYHSATLPSVLDRIKPIVVNYHNRMRGKVARGEIAGQPAAANMKAIKWDDNLAIVAQEWAEKCKFAHRYGSDKVCGVSNYTYLGENIKVSCPKKTVDEMSDAELKKQIEGDLETMFLEHKDYTFLDKFKFKNCNNGRMCGHYTQIAWGDTETIGCGIKHCSHIEYFGKSEGYKCYFWACNYGPGGNYEDSQPYKRGSACTACPSEAPHCRDSLCEGPGTAPICRDVNNQKDCDWQKSSGQCDACRFSIKYNKCAKTCGLCDYK